MLSFGWLDADKSIRKTPATLQLFGWEERGKNTLQCNVGDGNVKTNAVLMKVRLADNQNIKENSVIVVDDFAYQTLNESEYICITSAHVDGQSIQGTKSRGSDIDSSLLLEKRSRCDDNATQVVILQYCRIVGDIFSSYLYDFFSTFSKMLPCLHRTTMQLFSPYMRLIWPPPNS